MVNMVPRWGRVTLEENISFTDGCKKLEEAGADVVGLNCSHGPGTILPLTAEIKKVLKVCFQVLKSKKCVLMTIE